MTDRPTASPSPDRAGDSPWTIPDAAKFLRVSSRHLTRLITADRVKSITIGRRRLIPAAEIRRIAAQGC